MLPTLWNGSVLPTAAGEPANRLSSLFDRFFQEDIFTPTVATPGWSARPLSLWQDEHAIYVEMDAPGMTDKDIDVTVQEGDLIIRGERKCERKAGGYDSRTYGPFEQRVGLPSSIATDKVEAKLTNGVLTITLPKSEAAKPRKIALKSE